MHCFGLDYRWGCLGSYLRFIGGHLPTTSCIGLQDFQALPLSLFPNSQPRSLGCHSRESCCLEVAQAPKPRIWCPTSCCWETLDFELMPHWASWATGASARLLYYSVVYHSVCDGCTACQMPAAHYLIFRTVLWPQIFRKCYCEDYSNWDCFHTIQQYLDLRFNYIESSWYAVKHLFDTHKVKYLVVSALLPFWPWLSSSEICQIFVLCYPRCLQFLH